jgi:hypothetical protein
MIRINPIPNLIEVSVRNLYPSSAPGCGGWVLSMEISIAGVEILWKMP